MRYQQAIEYLFGLRRFGIKPGLANIFRLLAALGNPQATLACIHVAGSNGKGSTCAFLQAVFKEAGYAAGMYTSPHLSDYTERIRVNDACIPRAIVAALVRDIRRVCEKKSMPAVTFFEITTALAFLYFAATGADPVIIETGMGGTYDATNCIQPMLTVITSISLEHQKYLGATISAIAAEKAGIIKPGIPLICGVRRRTAQKLLQRTCHACGSGLLQLDRDFLTKKSACGGFDFEGGNVVLRNLRCGLAGDHQRDNAALAIAGACALRANGYGVSVASIRNGIRNARWPGRLELLGQAPDVIADGAHNPEGLQALLAHLAQRYPNKKLIFVLGMMQDKDIAAMLRIVRKQAHAIVLCMPRIDRAAGYGTLKNFISFSEKKRVFWFENSADAYAHALRLAGSRECVCITGSLFLVGELRDRILRRRPETSGRIAL